MAWDVYGKIYNKLKYNSVTSSNGNRKKSYITPFLNARALMTRTTVMPALLTDSQETIVT